jgi:FtsH-binding integral membrane protein
MFMLFAASGLSLASIAAVYQSWRRQTGPMLYVGIGVWLLSSIAWSLSVGWEFGVLYALCLPGLLVWPFIAMNQSHMAVPLQIPQPRKLGFSPRTSIQHALHYIVVLLLLLVFSVVASLAICALLPMNITGQLATCMVISPIIWGLAVYHYLATSKKIKTVGGYLVATAVSVAILMAMPI